MPYVYTPKICPVWARAVNCVSLLVFSVLAWTGWSAVPAPEKLLPDDTLLVLTAPDFAKLRASWEQMPLSQLWADPAMKSFRDDFVKKWKEEFIQPLERELDIKVSDYTSLVQGQITFAF